MLTRSPSPIFLPDSKHSEAFLRYLTEQGTLGNTCGRYTVSEKTSNSGERVDWTDVSAARGLKAE